MGFACPPVRSANDFRHRLLRVISAGGLRGAHGHLRSDPGARASSAAAPSSLGDRRAGRCARGSLAAPRGSFKRPSSGRRETPSDERRLSRGKTLLDEKNLQTSNAVRRATTTGRRHDIELQRCLTQHRVDLPRPAGLGLRRLAFRRVEAPATSRLRRVGGLTDRTRPGRIPTCTRVSRPRASASPRARPHDPQRPISRESTVIELRRAAFGAVFAPLSVDSRSSRAAVEDRHPAACWDEGAESPRGAPPFTRAADSARAPRCGPPPGEPAIAQPRPRLRPQRRRSCR